MTDHPDDDEVQRALDAELDAGAEKLITIRGYAINAYAGVEAQLNNLFSWLLDTHQDVSSLIFYRVANTRSRNAMMQDLIKRKCGDTYKVYWASMFKFISKLDRKRNEIVHWHFGALDPTAIMPALANPKSGFGLTGEPIVTMAEIDDFIRKCDFVSQSLGVFWMIQGGGLTLTADDGEHTWRGTFLLSVVYPPPEAHPLHRMMQKYRTRPLPSPE